MRVKEGSEFDNVFRIRLVALELQELAQRLVLTETGNNQSRFKIVHRADRPELLRGTQYDKQSFEVRDVFEPVVKPAVVKKVDVSGRARLFVNDDQGGVQKQPQLVPGFGIHLKQPLHSQFGKGRHKIADLRVAPQRPRQSGQVLQLKGQKSRPGIWGGATGRRAHRSCAALDIW